MKTSKLLISSILAVASFSAEGRLLKFPIVPRLQCWIRFIAFDLDPTDFSEYGKYFRDDSTMTLAQAGTYTGADAIEEYSKFTYAKYSPYFGGDELDKSVQQKVKFLKYDYKTGECVFLMNLLPVLEMDPEFTAGEWKKEVAYLAKLFFKYNDRYLSKANLFYPEAFINEAFSASGPLDSDNTRQFVCDVMTGPCAENLNVTAGTCMEDLAKLPMITTGARLDGNTQGCRMLHAVFADTNPEDHCAHLSFSPLEDPKGKFKCQENEDVRPEDLFDARDRRLYRRFCRKNDLDPSIGFRSV